MNRPQDQPATHSGICRVCGQRILIRRDGYLHPHGPRRSCDGGGYGRLPKPGTLAARTPGPQEQS